MLLTLLYAEVPWLKINPDENRFVNCLICGSSDPKPIGSIIINQNNFYLVRCRSDNLIWLNPQPGPTFLDSLYTKEFYEVEKHAPKLIFQLGVRKFDEEKIAEIRVREIEEYIYGNKNSAYQRKILEIGVGEGHFQKAVQESGWKAIGLEVSPYCIEECARKGLTVFPLNLEDFVSQYPFKEYFDLITMYDSIEHTTDPIRTLKLARNLLKKNSYLVIRTPNVDEKTGPRLHLIDHLWHFSANTLEILLKGEGFQIFKKFESGIFPPGAKGINRIVNMTIIAKRI